MPCFRAAIAHVAVSQRSFRTDMLRLGSGMHYQSSGRERCFASLWLCTLAAQTGLGEAC